MQPSRLCWRKIVTSLGIRRLSSVAPELNSKGPWNYREQVNRNSTAKLDATMTDMFKGSLGGLHDGDALPSGYHLIYFNPETSENLLESDGYEGQQSPGGKYVNRMWLGGSMEFHPLKPLLLGQSAFCTETIQNIRHLVSNDSDRVTVTLDRRMGQLEDGEVSDAEAARAVTQDWSVREVRSLVYFTQQGGLDRTATFRRYIKPPSGAEHEHGVKVTQTALFRYSALTFNSHKIHYDRMYAQQQEKLPDLIVHGPFTVTILLAWMQNKVIPPNRLIKAITYKNLLPLFVDEHITLRAKAKGEDSYEVWMENSKGSYSVSATLELH